MNHRRRLVLGIVAAVAVVGVLLIVGRSGLPTAPDPRELTDQDQGATAPSTTDLRMNDPAARAAPGFPRTREGAVAAATAYGLALDGPKVFDPAHRAAVLDAIAADSARDELGATFDGGLDLIRRQIDLDDRAVRDPEFVWRVVPAGWQLRAYDGSDATVAIWAAVVIMAEDRLLVEPGWQTSEVTLTWQRDGWRLVGFRTEPGPNPAFATRSGGESIARRISAFAAYRHWPASADAEQWP